MMVPPARHAFKNSRRLCMFNLVEVACFAAPAFSLQKARRRAVPFVPLSRSRSPCFSSEGVLRSHLEDSRSPGGGCELAKVVSSLGGYGTRVAVAGVAKIRMVENVENVAAQ